MPFGSIPPLSDRGRKEMEEKVREMERRAAQQAAQQAGYDSSNGAPPAEPAAG